jgi:Uma2 family endonuclease
MAAATYILRGGADAMAVSSTYTPSQATESGFRPMTYALRDSGRYTYADYRRWPDNARYELIDGAAYLMAPAPSVNHQILAFEVARQVADALQGGPCRVLVAPVDVLLPRPGQEEEEVDTLVQPDVLVVCDPAKVHQRGIRGAPDWVLEVVSPASAAHDQTRKLMAYERAGLPEYWLAHPVDRVLTIYRLQGSTYDRPLVTELVGTTSIDVLPGVTLTWAPIVEHLLPAD